MSRDVSVLRAGSAAPRGRRGRRALLVRDGGCPAVEDGPAPLRLLEEMEARAQRDAELLARRVDDVDGVPGRARPLALELGDHLAERAAAVRRRLDDDRAAHAGGTDGARLLGIEEAHALDRVPRVPLDARLPRVLALELLAELDRDDARVQPRPGCAADAADAADAPALARTWRYFSKICARGGGG